MTVTLIIPGKPFAKQRPRFSRKSGRAFTPKETVSFEATVAAIAVQQFPEPLLGPVVLTIRAIFEPPQSWSQKKKDAHLYTPHTQRPDLDNIEKAILDGLNRVAFADDGQVYELNTRKTWGEQARTIVRIEERRNVQL